jgi:sortase A
VVQRVGAALVAAGLLVLAGVAGWVVVGDWWADRSAAGTVAGLERGWAAGAPSRPGAGDGLGDGVGGGVGGGLGGGGRFGPARVPPDRVPPAPGSAFAVLRVPRFGSGWARPVIEGTGSQELRRGVGHYPGTALPGADGNFSIAGHRTTWGHPFGDIDRLQVGDEVVVETATAWFSYRVTGHEIVRPEDGATLAAGRGATITLTACHPEWSARLRWVVHGTLVSGRSRTAGT